MRTARTVLAACVALAMLMAACSSEEKPSGTRASDNPRTTATPFPPPMTPVLGVANAGGGTFDGSRLALRDVPPDAVWFTDRPQRSAGQEEMAAFLEHFFARQVPPNAALVFQGAATSEDVAIVELSNPSYDRKAGTLSLDAKVIAKDDVTSAAAHPTMVAYRDRNDAKIPNRFGAVTAFIDSAANPSETPDEKAVQALADQYSSVEHGLLSVVGQIRSLYEKNPNDPPCIRQYLEQGATLLSNLYSVDGPKLRQLQTDLSKNNGVLPAADTAVKDSLASDLTTIQQSTEQLSLFLNKYLVNGRCP